MFPRSLCEHLFHALLQPKCKPALYFQSNPIDTLLHMVTKYIYDMTRGVKGRFLFLSFLSIYHIIAIYLQIQEIPGRNFSLVNMRNIWNNFSLITYISLDQHLKTLKGQTVIPRVKYSNNICLANFKNQTSVCQIFFHRLFIFFLYPNFTFSTSSNRLTSKAQC